MTTFDTSPPSPLGELLWVDPALVVGVNTRTAARLDSHFVASIRDRRAGAHRRACAVPWPPWSRGDTDLLRAAAATVHAVAAAVLADLDQTDPHETAA